MNGNTLPISLGVAEVVSLEEQPSSVLVAKLVNDDNPLVTQGTAAAVDYIVQTLIAAVTSDEIQTDSNKKKKNKRQKEKEKEEKEEEEEKKNEKEKMEKKEKDKQENENETAETEQEMTSRQKKDHASSLSPNAGSSGNVSNTLVVNADQQPLQTDAADVDKTGQHVGQLTLSSSVDTRAKLKDTAVVHENMDSSNKGVVAKKPSTSIDINRKKFSYAHVSRFQFVLLFIYAFL
jgi:outer membrane biosynthesis protein TonB